MSDDPRARALQARLFFIRLRLAARSGYDRVRLGRGTGARLAAAMVISAVFVFGLLAVSFALKANVGVALGGAAAILLFFFGISALLIVGTPDEQLEAERATAERDLAEARDDADWEQQRRVEREDRWEAEERRERRREDDGYDRRPRRREREDRYRCPYCRTREHPVWRTKISAAGWVFFWLTCLFICWPICWIGLLIKDTYRVCPDCGARS